VKKRYKKLREILDQAEMRERAEIVVENEKLKIVSPKSSPSLLGYHKDPNGLAKPPLFFRVLFLALSSLRSISNSPNRCLELLSEKARSP